MDDWKRILGHAARHRHLGRGRVSARPGWAGENGDRSDKALDPSQVAQSTIHLRTEGNERAWKDHLYSRCSPGKGASPGKSMEKAAELKPFVVAMDINRPRPQFMRRKAVSSVTAARRGSGLRDHIDLPL